MRAGNLYMINSVYDHASKVGGDDFVDPRKNLRLLLRFDHFADARD